MAAMIRAAAIAAPMMRAAMPADKAPRTGFEDCAAMGLGNLLRGGTGGATSRSKEIVVG